MGCRVRFQAYLLLLAIPFLESCSLNYVLDSNEYLGSKTPHYAHQLSESFEQVPNGCKLKRIEGIFRHASRYMNKSDAYLDLIEVLKSANTKRLLKKKGKTLLEWLKADLPIFQPGLLTSQGKKDFFDLGSRMCLQNKELFRPGDSNIQLVTTSRERTQESLEAFMLGLQSSHELKAPQFHINVDDSNLRYFDRCQRYSSYKQNECKALTQKNKLLVESDEKNLIQRDDNLREIFEAPILGEEAMRLKAWKVIDDLYELCQQDHNLDSRSAQNRYCSLLSAAMKQAEFQKDNADSYFKMGPLPINYGMSCALLEELFQSIERAITQESDVVAKLQFAHAETVVPLAAFFQLFPESLAQWNSSEVAPMGANFQLLTYECSNAGEKSHKVKMLYNEKEYHFATPACQKSFYCDFNEVKDYYNRRKNDLGMKSCSPADWNSWCEN